ncbi:hypothetical protein GCM10010517_53250 [Streptosporangium fragile]|uniref:Uncharacterized protein n=1 Tax=Streptosporangium fragile TaxID=46186 RepID=A0ABN3W3L1_9ACTN
MNLRERTNEPAALAGQKRASRGGQGGQGADVGWIQVAERSLSLERVHAGIGPRNSLITPAQPARLNLKTPEAIPHIGRNFSFFSSS